MQRILIIRFSSIGDIVLTTPVVRVLRTKYPKADIRFVTKPQFKELVASNPYLDGAFYLNEGVRALATELKAFKPDVVVDLHHNLRTRILKTLLGGKWLSFDKLNVEKWLKVNLKVDKLPAIHIVDRYLETVKPLGVVNDGKGLDYFFPKEFEGPVLPKPFSGGYVAVVIGAKFQTKQLPAHKLVALCNGLGKPIVLVGGKEDAALANAIIAQSSAEILNGCGVYSLHQSAFIVKQADVVITHDTGMMHIAAAFNKKIISIWGNTIPEFGMYPYLGNNQPAHLAQVAGLNCRPCSKIGYAKCPKGHFKCMEKQDMEQLILKTHQFLKK